MGDRTNQDATPRLRLGDLAVVIVIAVSAVLVMLRAPELLVTPVRVALGFLFVFVLPGYALTAALYPSLYGTTGGRSDGVGDALPTGDSLILTVGLSIAVVPSALLLVNFSQLPITQRTTLWTVATVTVAAAVVAAVRRYRASADRETGVPVGRHLGAVAGRLRGTATSGSAATTVAFTVLLLSSGIAGAALLDSGSGERYSELSLLTVDGNGNLTADGYPTSLTPGEPTSLVVGVGNHEGGETRYTVVVQLQDVVGSGDERSVRQVRTVDRYPVSVAPGETEYLRQRIEIGSGYEPKEHRLVFLLYRGDPPEAPTVSNAYRHAHLWVTVTE